MGKTPFGRTDYPVPLLHSCHNLGRYAPVLRPLTDLRLNLFAQMDNS
ncbi:hypothetical protein [Moorena producens]